MDPKKGLKFQRSVYSVIRFLFGGLLCLFTGFFYKPYKPKNKVFLLLGNHTMDLDPIYNVIVTKKHMRFVASANIMRGFPGCFVKWLAGPIPRYKGAPADDVVEAVKANLAAGVSVAMYPEGNTSWDGETGFISKRTAELVKDSGSALITYRAYGGYLKMPRWSKVKRRGKTFGEVAAEYSAEELSALSVEEIYNIIKRDLYVDAYKEQESRHWQYKCKARAEGLEAALYVCPECRRVGRLSSKEHVFGCECGKSWQYSLEGYLESDSGKTSILDWARWQKGWLKDNAEELRLMINTPIYENSKLKVFGDRLEIKEENGECSRHYWTDITKMSVFRATRLFFTEKGKTIEVYIDPSEGRVGQMYFALWRVCSGQEYV